MQIKLTTDLNSAFPDEQALKEMVSKDMAAKEPQPGKQVKPFFSAQQYYYWIKGLLPNKGTGK